MDALPLGCACLNIVPQIGLILTLSLYADSFSMSRKRNLFFERDFYTIFREMRINPCSALQRGQYRGFRCSLGIIALAFGGSTGRSPRYAASISFVLSADTIGCSTFSVCTSILTPVIDCPHTVCAPVSGQQKARKASLALWTSLPFLLAGIKTRQITISHSARLLICPISNTPSGMPNITPGQSRASPIF